MSVRLDFAGDASADELEFFSVERKWHFTNNGRHIVDRDEIVVRSGAKQERLRPARLEDEEDFYRGLIAQHTLPAYLAQFFLFDGERVQNLARRDMSTQVQLGIEGLLGASIIRALGEDLLKYAAFKKQAVATTGSESLQALAHELGQQKVALQREEQARDAALSAITTLTARREELFQHLRGGTGGAFANVRNLEQDRARLKLEINQNKDALGELLFNEFSLALAGPALRQRLREQLDGELRLSKWKASLATTSGKVEQFVAALATVSPDFSPPLDEAQSATLRRKVEAAWQTLWHPPPTDCAATEQHAYLGDAEKALVLGRIDEIGRLGQDKMEDIIFKLDAAERDLRRIETQIAEFAGIEGTLQKISDDLESVSKELADKEKHRGDAERQIEGLKAQVNSKNAEYSRALSEFEEARPALARATVAERINGMLHGFLQEAIEGQVSDIAVKMTEAFKEMAHKQVVDRIVIQSDCNVQLLTKNNRDVRTFDASAGENQIFSFALISAIAQAAETRFPIIIDTPLARLDREHRLNVLRHFTDRAGDQIILLSQNKEVVGEELDAIRTRVAQTYLVETQTLPNGMGRAHAVPGSYFEPIHR
jgi:DNA sulfur modification protein DndD